MRPSSIWKSLAIALWIAALFSAYLIRQPEPSSGVLRVVMAAQAGHAFQVYFDTGDGYSESASVRLPLVRTDGVPAEYAVPLPAARLKALRLDPVDAAGTVRLDRVVVQDRRGRVLREPMPGALQPVNQIASIEPMAEGGWRFCTAGAGDDPSIQWEMMPPMDLTVSEWGWVSPLGAALAGIWVGILGLWWLGRGRWVRSVLGWLDANWWVPNVILAVMAWSVLFDAPLPPIAELDSSWQQVMGLAAVKHWAFGREVVFTGGPLSFLNLPYAIPETVMVRLVWDSAGKLALCGLMLWMISGLSLWRRMAVVWIIIGFGRMFSDGVYLFMVVAYVVGGLIRPAAWPKTACALAGVVFFGLVKFTFLIVGALGVAIAAGVAMARGERRRAVGLSAAFLAGYAVIWMAVGQSLADLPAYVANSLVVSGGYPWAMSLEEPRSVFFCAIAVLGLLGCGLVWGLRQLAWRAYLTEWAVALFAGAALVLSWKHGFTRAAGHVLGFFWFSALLGCVLPSWLGASRRPFRFEIVVPVALLGAWLAFPDVMWSTPHNTWGRMRSCWRTLQAPGAFLSGWHEKTAREVKAAALPAVQSEVGAAPVDSFNFDQGTLLLNGLNYRPRPTIQAYTAYLPSLQQLSLDWLRSTKGADFILWRTSSVDGRFAPQDEALLWAVLPELFECRLEERGFALLKRRPVPRVVTGERCEVLQRRVSLGETIPVDASGRLWLQIAASPSWLGRLRALLYKPAQLELIIADSCGRELRHRLLPKVAESGFLISPVVETQADFLAYMRGEGGAEVRSVRVEAPSGHAKFWGGVDARVWRLPAEATGR